MHKCKNAIVNFFIQTECSECYVLEGNFVCYVIMSEQNTLLFGEFSLLFPGESERTGAVSELDLPQEAQKYYLAIHYFAE